MINPKAGGMLAPVWDEPYNSRRKPKRLTPKRRAEVRAYIAHVAGTFNYTRMAGLEKKRAR